MQHFGDICKINGAEVPIVDIVTGGSPCQDLSVAGKRAGLDGERSGLFMEQIRVIKEMREHDKSNKLQSGRANEPIRPRYMVWENVPGAFSSNGGEDFRIVLEETAKIIDENAIIPRPSDGKWASSGCILLDRGSIAWRVHDAQFWGVPQRRKRIALVADFGGASAPEILFERKSVSGDIEPGREKGQDLTRSVTDSVGEAISFQERAGCEGGGKGILIQTDRTGALSTLNNQSVLCIGGGQSNDLATPSEICKTLNCMEDTMKIVCFGVDNYNQTTTGGVTHPIRSKAVDCDHVPCVCYGLDRASFNQGKNAQYDFSVEHDLAQTVLAKGPGGVLAQQ